MSTAAMFAIAIAAWLARVASLIKWEKPVAWSFRTMFSIWFGVAYLITPMSYVLLKNAYEVESVHEWFRPWLMDGQWGLYLLLVSVGYVAYEFGFSLLRGVAVPAGQSREPVGSLTVARRAGRYLIVLGVLGYLCFIAVYGIDVALSTNIRYESSAVEGSWLGALFLYTRLWIFIGFLILLICHLVSPRRGKFDLLALGILFAIVVYTSIQGASRAYFLYLIVLPALCYFIANRRLPIGWIAGFCVAFPVIIVFGRSVLAYRLLADPVAAFSALSDAAAAIDMVTLCREIVASFAHPFASVFVVMDEVTLHDYRYFVDWPLAALFYLKAFGLDLGYSVTYAHTYVLSSELVSNIPPGIVASGYYQLGAFGVFLFLFMFGAMSRLLQNVLNALARSNPAHLAIHAFLGFVLGNFVMNGDPRVYFIRIALILFAVCIVLVAERVRLFPRLGAVPAVGRLSVE